MEELEETVAFPPAPRVVRRWRGFFRSAHLHIFLCFLGVMTLLFWKIGIGVVKILWFSEMVPARVVKVEVVQEEKGPGHYLDVAYRYDGAEYTDRLRISEQESATFKEGDRVEVLVLPEKPGRAHLKNENYPRVLVTVLMALIVLAPSYGVLKLLWVLYVVPFRVRQILRWGEKTSGVIVDKQEVRARPTGYRLEYAYRGRERENTPFQGVPPGVEGPTMRGMMMVEKEEYESVKVGDEVEVIYLPDRPTRSVMYRYADFEILGEEESV